MNTLKLFESAGRLNSFKHAAEELNVTPSAISHGVGTLEKWLGVHLFARDNRSLTLTDAGRAYLAPIAKALAIIDSASRDLAGLDGEDLDPAAVEPEGMEGERASCCGAPSRAPAPLRILVVDDDAAARQRAREVLSGFDMDVVEAGDGVAALRLAATEHLDAIVMERQLPRMDGLETCRTIRRLPGMAARTPIVGYTLRDTPPEIHEFLAAGADIHVSKAADRGELAKHALLLAVGGRPHADDRAAPLRTPVPPPSAVDPHLSGNIRMPGITLTVSGSRTAAIESLAGELTDLTCSLLDKRADQTVVLFRFVPHEEWFIAGRSLKDLARNSFRLEVTITDETCTKDQKAAYHRAAFALLCDRIGNVHPLSNIHVIDCRGSAYGYGGITQEHRYQHPHDPA